MNTVTILAVLAEWLPGLQIILYPRLVQIAYGAEVVSAASLPAAVQALADRILAEYDAHQAIYSDLLIDALRRHKTAND